MSEIYTAQELKDRLLSNDNRATAKPYLLLLQEKRTYIAHDEYDCGGVEDKFVEHYTGDYHTTDTKKEMINFFIDNGYELTSKILKNIKAYREGYYWETENVFLTDKGYEDHKKVNGHNLRKHRTYGIHAFRNKEIRSLFNLIDENIKLQEENEKLKKEQSKLTWVTCINCTARDTCKYAFDNYNTNGDCLAEK